PYVRETEFAVLHAHLVDSPPAASAVRPGLPRALDDVLAKAMAKTPSQRFSTGQALATAFRRVLVDAGAADEAATRAAQTVAQTQAATEPSRPRRRIAAFTVGAVLLAVLVGVAAAVLATRGGGGGAAQAPKVRTFVDRVENVLSQSAQGRREIGFALVSGFNCSITPREAGQRIAS